MTDKAMSLFDAVYQPDTLKKLASEETALQEFMKQHGKELHDALGLYGDDALFVLWLAKIREYIMRDFPMFKDDIDRARCNAISPLLQGQPVTDIDELRLGVGLLAQSYNAACARIRSLESAQRRRSAQIRPAAPGYWFQE